MDLDNDGDLDLSLGQNRDAQPSTRNEYSIVLLNDGTGHYQARIELPRPAFNEGYTSVSRSDASRRQQRRVPGRLVRAPAEQRRSS